MVSLTLGQKIPEIWVLRDSENTTQPRVSKNCGKILLDVKQSSAFGSSKDQPESEDGQRKEAEQCLPNPNVDTDQVGHGGFHLM